MGATNKVQIGFEYKQFFSPNVRRARGYMSLDESVSDVAEFKNTLERIADNVPEKENFMVGLNNCETLLHYTKPINCSADLDGPKQVLNYFLRRIDPRDKPFLMWLDLNCLSGNYIAEIEEYLNSIGKTLYEKKGERRPRSKLELLSYFLPGTRTGLIIDGIVRDLRRD